MLSLISQMGIAGGGEDGMVAEEFLHLDQIDAGLDQMGGIAVPQAMGRNLFLRPQAATT